MYLTNEEEKILEGEFGYIAQKAMKFLIKYGEAAGAERLVDIDGTVSYNPNVSWFPEIAVTHDELVELAAKGEKFKVPTFSIQMAPGLIVDGWDKCGCWPQNDPEYHNKRMESIKPHIKMGLIPTLSCDFYLFSSFLPTVGQHCAWHESSAIPWVNAILGARSNLDGCFEAAYLGKIPAYDMHLEENRKATRLVECKVDLRSDMDYELFGWAVGEAVGIEVPCIIGIGKPTTTQIVKMNAALNTGGQVRMYHAPGLTPEAPTIEHALSGKQCEEKIFINHNDLRKVYEKINYAVNRNVDFVYLGCPHYNIQEVYKVAKLLEGKKCKANLWVMTSPLIFKQAEMMGLKDIIEKSGGVLLSGTCPGLMRGTIPPANVMATDSAKQGYYITGYFDPPRKLEVWYGTVEDCINAALSGKWNGEWRNY